MTIRLRRRAIGNMPKALAWKELVRRLKAFEFDGPVWGTKHPFMVKGNVKLHIPSDHGSDIGAELVTKIVRDAGIDREERDRV